MVFGSCIFIENIVSIVEKIHLNYICILIHRKLFLIMFKLNLVST